MVWIEEHRCSLLYSFVTQSMGDMHALVTYLRVIYKTKNVYVVCTYKTMVALVQLHGRRSQVVFIASSFGALG